MRKIWPWLFAAAVVVFVIDWGIVGIRLLQGQYEITAGVWIGAVCWLLILALLVLRRFSQADSPTCPHCGKKQHTGGKYCSDCGKEIPRKMK